MCHREIEPEIGRRVRAHGEHRQADKRNDGKEGGEDRAGMMR